MKNKQGKNAVIMAAGKSTRFSPISYEYPKALVEVKGEVLIERQIRQLQEAGIEDITIVVGYKKELFYYLEDKLSVKIVENPEYNTRNNNSSLYYVKDRLSNTFICSADNYFSENVFEAKIDYAYYASIYNEGPTDEWCLIINEDNLITDVQIGGIDSWIMLGHVYFDDKFSKKFVSILEKIYDLEETKPKLWEKIYSEHIDELKLYIRKYSNDIIFEFDTLDELREFDSTYIKDTRSSIIKKVAKELSCNEKDIYDLKPLLEEGNSAGFEFMCNNHNYKYYYEHGMLENI